MQLTEIQQKAAFAAFLLDDPKDPLGAALKLYPADRDRGTACQISIAWPRDAEVIAEMNRLRAEGYGDEVIVTKKEAIESLLTISKTAPLAKDRIAAFRLIAEMQNFIAKPVEEKPVETQRKQTEPRYVIVQQ